MHSVNLVGSYTRRVHGKLHDAKESPSIGGAFGGALEATVGTFDGAQDVESFVTVMRHDTLTGETEQRKPPKKKKKEERQDMNMQNVKETTKHEQNILDEILTVREGRGKDKGRNPTSGEKKTEMTWRRELENSGEHEQK